MLLLLLNDELREMMMWFVVVLFCFLNEFSFIKKKKKFFFFFFFFNRITLNFNWFNAIQCIHHRQRWFGSFFFSIIEWYLLILYYILYHLSFNQLYFIMYIMYIWRLYFRTRSKRYYHPSMYILYCILCKKRIELNDTIFILKGHFFLFIIFIPHKLKHPNTNTQTKPHHHRQQSLVCELCFIDDVDMLICWWYY